MEAGLEKGNHYRLREDLMLQIDPDRKPIIRKIINPSRQDYQEGTKTIGFYLAEMIESPQKFPKIEFRVSCEWRNLSGIMATMVSEEHGSVEVKKAYADVLTQFEEIIMAEFVPVWSNTCGQVKMITRGIKKEHYNNFEKPAEDLWIAK